MKNETIDEIRERYKYEIEITDIGKTAASMINIFFMHNYLSALRNITFLKV